MSALWAKTVLFEDEFVEKFTARTVCKIVKKEKVLAFLTCVDFFL